MCTNQDIIAMLCRRIKAARIEKNWSQLELSERAHLGIATIKRVEMGGAVTLLTLIAILRGLGQLDQLNTILVHKEPTLYGKRQKLPQRKRRLINQKSDILASCKNHDFMLTDETLIMRWQ